MQNLLVSIIVPVYNGEKYIARCVDSLASQTYKNLEIILVDDGSTDTTSGFVDMMSKTDLRIKALHQENAGQASARNAGLDICNGDYIAFVDADDFITTDHIEKMMDISFQYNADLVQCRYDVGFNSVFSDDNQQEAKITDYNGNEIFESEIFKSVAWGKLYRRRLFDKTRFPVNNFIEDEAIAYILHYEANKTICTDEKLYYAYMSKGSTTREKKKYPIEFMDVFEDRLRYFQSRNENKLYEISIIKYCLALSIRYMRMYCGGLNSKDELKLVRHRFDQLYETAIKSEYISKKYAAIIRNFKRFPKMAAVADDIITRIRRLCGSY